MCVCERERERERLSPHGSQWTEGVFCLRKSSVTSLSQGQTGIKFRL